HQFAVLHVADHAWVPHPTCHATLPSNGDF
ncbi:MAG: hypothetical protein ACI8T1_004303, partial [Verrucomicrobiales bacterium]